MKPEHVVAVLMLTVSVLAHADGQRLYPDPFLRCEDPFIALRTSDLTDKPDVQSDVVVVNLPQQRLLAAPERIELHGVKLDGYEIGYAYTEQSGELSNSCTYKYASEYSAFKLESCERVQNSSPLPVLTQQMTLRVPGIEHLSRVTAWARFKGVQSSTGCGGRTPLNGQKFFNRSNSAPDRWFAVVDEALVAPSSVATLANQLAQAFNGEVDGVYTSGPLAFAIKLSASSAQSLSLDNRIRFVESVPYFKALGIRAAEATLWAQDRIDQEPSRNVFPPDNRLRWPEYMPTNTARPGLFVLDTLVRNSHTAFAGLSPTLLDPNPSLPSCSFMPSGGEYNDHGTGVAALLVGSYSTTQRAALRAYFVKALGQRGLSCSAGDGITVGAALNETLREAIAGDVVSMSLGASELSGFIEMQIEQLLRTGKIVVASAGNERAPVSYPPANIPDVITVGATNSDDDRYQDPLNPNRGTNYGPEVEVFAPGVQVLSASPASLSGTDEYVGTSLATPLVSGVVFHNLATSGDWPIDFSIEVARGQAQKLVAEGVSHSGDVLPVLRGKPLELSPTSGIATMQPPGVSREKLAVDGFGSVWRGRSGDNSGFSLGVMELQQGDAYPRSSSTFVALRENEENCAALTGFEGGSHPSGEADVLVGCYGQGSSYLGLYNRNGEFRRFRIQASDAPLYARTSIDFFGRGDLGIGGVTT